ncbi:MAG: HAD family hydrolase [Patescibacteria group bacterium]|nr:HAD family hydrolase [Patescibacteria group bacterium]MDD4304355.1 HAD family hydrolase [Patescibacteria group bacterium]MDD4695378.1 HAD family hydrolase [Patescibacteria group bacterium]
MKSIIFDWAGVISNSFETNSILINAVLERFGAKRMSLDEIRENWEMPYMKFYNKFLPNLTIKEEAEAFSEFFKDSKKANIYPGVKNILEKFYDNKINMFVVTGDLDISFREDMNRYGLGNIFTKIYTNVHDKTKIIGQVINENKLDINNTYIIADTTHEMEIGKIYNIKTVAITWGFQSREKLKLSNPDYLIDNFEEFENIILNNNK